MPSTIGYEVSDGVATVTLNRPDRLNAFNGDVFAELVEAFDATDADYTVRAVVVTGAGRAFCAGADLGAPPPSAPTLIPAPTEARHPETPEASWCWASSDPSSRSAINALLSGWAPR